MGKLVVTILATLLLGSKLNAQLFVKQEVYPDISTVEARYYNGSGGGGYWSVSKLDTLGRTIEKGSYRKKELLARDKFVYNSNNDQLYYIVKYDINNPNRIDTISNYEYKYEGGRIVYQKNTHSNRCDSTVIQLIENKGDTVLTYQDKTYYLRPKTNATEIYERIHILKYQKDLLVHKEKFDLNRKEKEITVFEYHPNGRLKRRKIQREPEPELKGVYVGGPGSDDEFYEYKFDKWGRVKAFYRIIGKEKYKIATYEYNKK